MRKLKVGIVCPYDFFRFGGVQEHARAVYEELKRRGYHAKLIVPASKDSRDNTNPDILPIGTATKVNTPMATTADIAFSASPGEITQLLNKEKFDILHFHEPWVPLLSRQLITKSKAKHLATFHAKLPENSLNTSIQRAWLPYGKRIIKYLDEITAVSEAALDFISLATDRPIRIVPNGIELKDYNPKNVEKYAEFDDDVPTIFYVGRLEKRKGVNYLLKAYRQLSKEHPEVRLVIAGDGPKMRSLKAYVTRYGLNNINFLGFVSDADKKSLLKTCDVFCSPAIYGESFGIVLLEAMAMGAPIVAGNNPGYASVMKDKGRLSLVDPKSTADFAYRLELLLFQKTFAEELADWGKQYVRQFDYTKVTDAYEEIYAEMLKK